MFRIVTKRPLHDTVTLMEIEAPAVARKALPGQFIILRIDEAGERIPLTVAGTDRYADTGTDRYTDSGSNSNIHTGAYRRGEGDTETDREGSAGFCRERR